MSDDGIVRSVDRTADLRRSDRYEIEADSDALIFNYSDRVVQEKLDFFREQRGRA